MEHFSIFFRPATPLLDLERLPYHNRPSFAPARGFRRPFQEDAMRRDIFSPDHELFREQFRRFAEKEIVPARHE
jgi:hypothetical protein